MRSSARESYLVTEIMTATPQKLQLLLIEAAIRSAQRARQKWQEEDCEQACEALIHAQEIVGELLAALDRELNAELVKKMAAIYLFVFRSLMEANSQRDQQKLNDAIKVLEVERQTWQMVCEKLGGRSESHALAAADSPPKPSAAPPAPGLPGPNTLGDLPAAGLSLQG
jgi:flagellar protein FliS